MKVEKLDGLVGCGIIVVTDVGNFLLKYPDVFIEGEKKQMDSNEINSLIESIEENIPNWDCLKSPTKMFLNVLIQEAKQEYCNNCGGRHFKQEKIVETIFKQCGNCGNMTTYKLI